MDPPPARLVGFSFMGNANEGAGMIVMKFGGTSVEDSAAIERAADIVLGRMEQRPVVVVSALAGVTDSLLAMAKAAASGLLPQAVESLRQVRQRHLDVLSALVMESGRSRGG